MSKTTRNHVKFGYHSFLNFKFEFGYLINIHIRRIIHTRIYTAYKYLRIGISVSKFQTLPSYDTIPILMLKYIHCGQKKIVPLYQCQHNCKQTITTEWLKSSLNALITFWHQNLHLIFSFADLFVSKAHQIT